MELKAIKRPITVLLLGVLVLSLPCQGSEEDPDIEVRVDKRVEAMAIAQYLADRLEAFPSPYQRKVEEHFRPHEDHPTVEMLRDMMNIDTLPKGIHSESCMLAMYLHHDLKGVHPLNEQDSSVYSSYYGHERIREMLRSIPDFIEDTEFRKFRKRMGPYYRRWSKEMSDFLKSRDRSTPFRDLFEKEKDWLLILNPLKKIQSAHATRTTKSFNKDTNCFSYSYREPEIKDSVAFLKSHKKMRDLFWHEGTHLLLGEGSFVRYKEELESFQHQFDSVRSRIEETMGYDRWLRYVDECIAYGASLYLLKKEEPDRFPYQKLLMKYNGFAHTEHVLNAFQRYDALDEKDSDIPSQLYPLILDEFEKVETGELELATDLDALKKKGMKMREKRESP
jgi:hypothetical protein